MTGGLTDKQAELLTRAAVLLGGYARVLSEHEQTVCAEASERYRRKARATSLTIHEQHVVEDAVAAMEAAWREANAPTHTPMGRAAGSALASTHAGGKD